MTINIIAVGKLQAQFRKIFANYEQKIRFYAKVNVIEIREYNHVNAAIQKAKETKAIIAKIPKNSQVFLCTIHGTQYDSFAFTKLVQGANITFVIGGSHGVIEEEFATSISFSQMTFPHQLFRIMLIEQIYRKIAIDKNLKYHK